MSLALVTVCDSISKIVVAGMSILDVDEIPVEVGDRKIPVMFPEPLNFITNFTVTRETWAATGAALNVEYDLNYTFAYAPIGSGRTGLNIYDDMVTKALAICDQVMTTISYTGAVKIDLVGPLEFGPVVDPAGLSYLGCHFVFHVLEFVN